MQDLAKLSLLLVDDNRDWRDIVRRLLNSAGVQELHEADDGAAGLQVLGEHRCDIVITDLVMAPMDGLEFARRVRRGGNGINPMVPIIMVTSYPERERVKAARDAGVSEFLIKPITPAHLFARLEDVLERPRPFVETNTYFGPDRRRKSWPDYKGPFRRKSDKVWAV